MTDSTPDSAAPDAATMEAMAQLFKALADPTRLRILHFLGDREQAAGAIARALAMSPSAVSHQLAFLHGSRSAGRLTVLVITGKGGGKDLGSGRGGLGSGVLRDAVPRWCCYRAADASRALSHSFEQLWKRFVFSP